MKKYILFVLPFMLLLTQCNKETVTESVVSGRVLEFGSDKPVIGATVTLWEYGASSCWGCKTTKILEKTLTDASGHFGFKQFGNLAVTSNDNSFYDKHGIEIPQTSNVVPPMDIRVTPPAYFKAHFFNAYPLNEGDRVNLSIYDSPPISISLVGKAVDTTIVFRCRALTDNTVSQSVTKKGVTEIKTNNIIIPTRDTMLYEVRY